MKYSILKPVEIDIKYVEINIPVRFGDEDMSYDAPLRCGDMWEARIDIDKGIILGWPSGKALKLHLKVCDSGIYTLRDSDMQELASLEGEYVPHGVIPGSWGDYVELHIDESGKITNWPEEPDVCEFFGEETD